MKQLLQSLKTGETLLEDVPCPMNGKGSLLIETRKTLVSAGTERMLVEFGKASLLGKIKQQPDKVKTVLDKIKTDGLATTLEAVKSKLEQPIPLGYCNVGTVLEIGGGVSGFETTMRVISNGNHAEIVRVPKNLCAKVPENVSDDEAVFTVLAAIALQGVRLSQPTLGESYAVIGLGLIGLITVQLLGANGCRVIAADFDSKKCEFAKAFGAEVVDLSQGGDVIASAKQFSRGKGIDAVIITASTKSNEPLHQAATMCRKRGRIVLVGVIGNEFSRADFYEKELTFQVSCSYGPGRYDETYEQQGQDYPIGFVRWTEQRNFEAILEMMSTGALDVKPLITHYFDITEAVSAYQTLEKDKTALGIILNYPLDNVTSSKLKKEVLIPEHQAVASNGKVNVGFIGAGNYGARMLAPAFNSAGAKLVSVVSSQGISGKLLAKKLGFAKALTDEAGLLQDESIQVAVIATRHNLHSSQVIESLRAGKHVFVEKPLCLTQEELGKIEEAYNSVSVDSEDRRQRTDDRNQHPTSDTQYSIPNTQHPTLLMLGFNRRFAPQVQTMKKLLGSVSTPKSFIMTINAGEISEEHWTQDMQVGGGRILGEACHFIDLLRFLAGSKISAWQAVCVDSVGVCDDKAMITLSFEDGSIGAIHYLANGHKSVSKERLEVFCAGRTLHLDNFRKLQGYGWSLFKKQNLRKQDKGQNACVKAFVRAIETGGVSPIPFNEILEVSRVSIEIAEYLRK